MKLFITVALGCIFLLTTNLAEALEINPLEKYMIEIVWDPDVGVVTGTPEELFDHPSVRLVFFNRMVPDRQFESLVEALGQYKKIDGTFEKSPTWGILVKDRKGKVLYKCVIDAWAKSGIVDGQFVGFDKILGDWIRNNLTQVFELKSEPIWSRSSTGQDESPVKTSGGE